jgi:hypothetical protein
MSRDVIFEEDKTWQWNDDQEAVKWISTDLILEDEVEVLTVLTEGPILQQMSHKVRYTDSLYSIGETHQNHHQHHH